MSKGKKSTNRNEIDMLNGTLLDKIVKFAVPLAVTSVLQQIFNATDTAHHSSIQVLSIIMVSTSK